LRTKHEVEAKLRELISRLEATEEARGSLAGSLPEPRIIAVQVPDLGTEYWTEMTDGAMDELREGAPERADIRIRATSDHLVDIIDGRRSMFSSVMTGQVKVEAGLTDLLRLRRLG
jgi:putative sterol carrier protein